MLGGLAGLLSHGLIGGNFGLWVIAPIFATAFFSICWGLICTGLGSIAYAGTGFANLQGWWFFDFNAKNYLNASASWIERSRNLPPPG